MSYQLGDINITPITNLVAIMTKKVTGSNLNIIINAAKEKIAKLFGSDESELYNDYIATRR